jgi:AraC-like DNA-binding protein
MPRQENTHFNYMVSSPEDELWGITVTTVGHQFIEEDQVYPPCEHPCEYLFDPEKGRVLNEFQLLYITRGHGTFTFDMHTKQSIPINEGHMFFLMPGVWHSYKPLQNSGWNEYWIGFRGQFVEQIKDAGFFMRKAPVFNVGLNERLVDLYHKAIEIASEERAGYQQALGGIVMHILGLMYYRDKTRDFQDEVLIRKMQKAKVIMRETLYSSISPELIARQLSMSYSGFRRAFREYTGTSPSKYMIELKMNEAKLLLSTSSLSVKEIAYKLNFDNPDYFPVFFKKRTGLTPLEYRTSTLIKE